MANKQPITGALTWLGIVGFIILILGCIMLIYPARVQYARQLEFYSRIKAEADQKRYERDALQKEVAELQSSPKAIEKVARENFRLCKEGEVVMYYKRPAGSADR